MHKILELRNKKLLQQALTHRSYVNENPGEGEHNERLEFLGDALLNYLSGEYLYNRHPEKGEDELTRRRSALVDEKQLAKFAIEVGLDSKMLLGKGAIKDGGYKNPNLLSSTFEAVIGAYYLDNDSQIEAVRAIIEPLFDSVSEQMMGYCSNVDSQNRFQQWALASENIHFNPERKPPDYITIAESGEPHAREFTVEVRVNCKVYGVGKGRRRQDARKAAAEDALAKLKKQGLL
jgi:ribonuclease III